VILHDEGIMPLNGNSRLVKKSPPRPAPGSANELHCKQASLSKRGAKAPITRNNASARHIKPNQSEEAVIVPLRIDIKVTAPRSLSHPEANRSKTPLQQGNDDKWMLYNHTTNDARVQSLAPYQYNSIRQRKDSKGKIKSKTPTPTLSPTTTSFDSGHKSNASGSRRSKSTDYTPRSTKTHAKQTSEKKNDPCASTHGISEKSVAHYVPVDTQWILSDYKSSTERLYSPQPIEMSNSQKAFTMKEDGTIKSCDFYVPVPNHEDDGDNEESPGERPSFSERVMSPQRRTPSPKEPHRSKHSGISPCLSDSNILEIMEKDNCRFESFDSASCRQYKFRPPLIEMPEKVWKVKMPPEKHIGTKIRNMVMNEKGRAVYAMPNLVKTKDMTFSDVLTSIDHIKDIDQYKQIMVGIHDCKCPTRRPASSPVLSKSELRLWDQNNNTTNQIKKRNKKSTKCRRSRSSSDFVGGRSTPSVIEKLEGSKSKGKMKRVMSPSVSQSASLYDYCTLVI